MAVFVCHVAVFAILGPNNDPGTPCGLGDFTLFEAIFETFQAFSAFLVVNFPTLWLILQPVIVFFPTQSQELYEQHISYFPHFYDDNEARYRKILTAGGATLTS